MFIKFILILLVHFVYHVRCVYDVDHMYALWIQNTSETDHSYEATKAVAKEALEKLLMLTLLIVYK